MEFLSVFKNVRVWIFSCALISIAAQDNTFSTRRLTEFYNEVIDEQKAYIDNAVRPKPPTPPPPVPPPQKIGYVPFSFVNGSNNSLIKYTNTYIVAKGLDPATNAACFISFDAQGVGSCVDAGASTVASDYTYLLSSFPTVNGVPYVYIPSVTSARLYVSLNYELVLKVNSLGSGVYTIGDPSPTITTDPSYYHLYDKVEFNIQPNQCVINPTLVDFFCIPLPITVTANGGCNTLYAGMPPTQNRESIFTGYQSAAAALTNSASMAQWSGLLLAQTSPAKNLRLLSTNTAINSAPPQFDTSYLLNSVYGANWLTSVWSNGSNAYYETNMIYMDLSQIPTYGIYSGQVNRGTGTFLFTPVTGSGSAVSVTLPTTSNPFFGGTGFTVTGDTTASPIIEKFLSAGLESGILPTPSTQLDPINNKFFQSREPYYQPNAVVTAGGPWYDLYSKILHSYAVYPYNFYTYAYDDVLGNDNTITSNNILLDPINITITIGDMSGTTP